MNSLRMGFLSCEGGNRIPVKVRRWEERTFIECDFAQEILQHFGFSDVPSLGFHGTVLRGVLVPGEGGYFQLFDNFGATHREPLRLAEAQADARFLKSLIWEV